MSEFTQDFTSGSRQTQTSYTSPFTHSSAKKFVSVNAVENNSPTDSVDNSEHLVNLAAGMRTLSFTADALAAQARNQIAGAMSGVFNVDGVQNTSRRQPTVQFSEEDVNTVQSRMIDVAGQAYANVQDPTIRDQIIRQLGNHVYNARHAFIPVRSEDMTIKTTNLIIPQIESAEVEIAKNKGATDNFYVGLTFNIRASDSGSVKLIRIFRSEVNDPIFTRPIPVISSNGMQRVQSFRGVKSQDQAAITAKRFDEMGVRNAVSTLNYVNPFTGQRVSAVGDSSLLIPPPLSNRRPSQNFNADYLPDALSHLDKSVVQNINVLYNLQNNPILGINRSFNTEPLTVGKNRASGSWNPLLIDQSNKLEFKEIAQFTPGGLTTRLIGQNVEYYFEDATVSFGGGYKYFICTVDDKAIQSARSTVVDVVVEGLRVPPRPANNSALIGDRSITLTTSVNDQLVEKFEVYRKDESQYAASQALVQTIADQQGFSVSAAEHTANSNKFLLIGECFNSMKSGGTFIDNSVTPGLPYTYRVYSVDVFGNKSESPLELNAYIPDKDQQYIAFKTPALLAEVDANTHKMKLTFSCDDSLIQRLYLERRDLTTGEKTFSVPQSQSRIIMGYGRSPIKNRASMSGERLFNESADDVWTGVFDNVGQQAFIDKTVQYDHIYQYRIFGDDRYGNKTSYSISPPLMIVRHPLINVPVKLAASAAVDSNGFLQGTFISWNSGTLDISAGDQLGSQNSLIDTAVRTLYQVQRRQGNEDHWLNFPLVSGTHFIDAINAGSRAPAFRPPFVDVNQTYQYRVQAVQTGSFISNFTDPVSVFVGYDIAIPENFVLRTPSTTVKPFYVMLNWDVKNNSGVVDRWEIERSTLNNIAAAQFNTQNPDVFSTLSYESFRTVYRESSRFSGQSVDNVNGSVNAVILVGSNYYMDTAVDFGNTYFYRIRAVSPENRVSDWSYRGIKITSTVFEQKYAPLISSDDKQALMTSKLPLVLQQTEKLGVSSYSMLSSYARPDSTRISKKRYSKGYSEEDT
jgi:hypothetical protein